MRLPTCLLAALALVLTTLPAGAVPVPVLASDNVELIAQLPDATAVSGVFDPERPYFYASTRHGITVYDVSDPALPVPAGAVPFVGDQNEAVSMGAAGVREDGTTFVLFGLDTAGATLPVGGSIGSRQVSGSHVFVIDVTDPAAPFVRSQVDASTNTHTVSCVDLTCDYAYTAGTRTTFSVIDLRDLDAPAEVEVVASPFGWHDWDTDDAGIAWQTGDGGTAAFDVSDPTAPVLLNTTDERARVGHPDGYNDFIHHNSIRPNALLFDDDPVAVDGTPATADQPSLDHGNVLLVTEEDYLSPTCGGGEGSFSTWHVNALREEGVAYGEAEGEIAPLDQWTTELLGTGRDNPAGFFCSAHYFDVHHQGVTAHAWYQQGVRFLDVTDPTDIRQVGYFVPEASEVWSSYWVPQRDAEGRIVRDAVTGAVQHTDIVYTTDLVRGIDVLRVDLEGEGGASLPTVVAPILPSWLTPVDGSGVAWTDRRSEYGFVCLLTPRASR